MDSHLMNMTNGSTSPRSASPDRRASLTGEPSDLEIMKQLQEEALIPLKEDVADWLYKTLGELQSTSTYIKHHLASI